MHQDEKKIEVVRSFKRIANIDGGKDNGALAKRKVANAVPFSAGPKKYT
jgi:hypothetical protein